MSKEQVKRLAKEAIRQKEFLLLKKCRDFLSGKVEVANEILNFSMVKEHHAELKQSEWDKLFSH